MQTVYGKLNYIIKDQHEEIEELERQIAELNAEIAELNLQIESLQGDITLLTQQKEALEAQVVALETQLQDTTQYYLPYIQGTATEFVSDTITSLRPYTFVYDQNIEKVYLPNLINFPNQGFSQNESLIIADIPWDDNMQFFQCYNLNPCKKYSGEIVEKVLPQNVKSNGFWGCGKNINEEMPIIGNNTVIGSSAFYSSGLSKLTGTFGNIGDSGFDKCDKLQYVDITIKGSLGSQAFQGCQEVSHFNINSQSEISQIGQNCFYELGYLRDYPQNNIFEINLQRSSFTQIPQRLFFRCSYCNVYFPNTITSMSGYALSTNFFMQLRFNNITPPTLDSSTAIETLTNSKIFVPFDSLDAYKTATNWSVQAANIYPWKHYTAGDTLDSNYNWYSDIRLTNQVTGTAPETADYYGVAI